MKKIQLTNHHWIQGLGVLKPVINLHVDTTISCLIDRAKIASNANLVKSVLIQVTVSKPYNGHYAITSVKIYIDEASTLSHRPTNWQE